VWKQLSSNDAMYRVTKIETLVPINRLRKGQGSVLIYKETAHKSPVMLPIRPEYPYELKVPDSCFVNGIAAVDISKHLAPPDISIQRDHNNDKVIKVYVKAQPLKSHSLIILVIGYCQ